jgi:hypothetical protein
MNFVIILSCASRQSFPNSWTRQWIKGQLLKYGWLKTPTVHLHCWRVSKIFNCWLSDPWSHSSTKIRHKLSTSHINVFAKLFPSISDKSDTCPTLYTYPSYAKYNFLINQLFDYWIIQCTQFDNSLLHFVSAWNSNHDKCRFHFAL